MSKMNKPELYKLCKALQEENKKLQFDNNCLEEKVNSLDNRLIKCKELQSCGEKLQDGLNSQIQTQQDQINELRIMLQTKCDEILEYVGKISYLSEHYDEWKNRNAFNHLRKNYNHKEYMKHHGILESYITGNTDILGI